MLGPCTANGSEIRGRTVPHPDLTTVRMDDSLFQLWAARCAGLGHVPAPCRTQGPATGNVAGSGRRRQATGDRGIVRRQWL